MKKVVLSLALVAVLGLSFTSCKKAEGEATDATADTTVVEAPEAAPADTAVAPADSAAAPVDSAAVAPAAPAAH